MKEKNITISDIGLNEKKKCKVEKPKVDRKQKKQPTEEQKAKRSKFLILLLISLVGITIGGLLIHSVIAYSPVNTSRLINTELGFLKIAKKTPPSQKSYALPEPSEPKTKINPLNGVLLTNSEFSQYSKRRPVAVMVNNHAAARPQANLAKADIVYEALVESGITRYMPIYWQNAVTKVGPIRSVRQYYLEWLSEYDAVFIHDGYASGDDPRIDAGGNMYRYGIKTISTQGAWRDPSRVAPHNEYSSIANALNIAEKNEWTGLPSSFRSWIFKNDLSKANRGDMKEVNIVAHSGIPNAGLYNTKWTYDKDSNKYLRYIAGQPDIDQESNSQISAKVVILQETNMTPTFNEKAHIIIVTQGSGNATVLMDGQVIDAEWKKESRTTRTRYFDKEGNELELNRGLIWIVSIATGAGSFDIIEQ